ncbi:hypothetical protein C3B54_111132 [Pontimonas salivibrio]|uniref:Uncharacterized protein n=2 Tax=Microbacteriaceae TaxID=85023 RepID=A0A2L2BR37_9MICO|nr:hypothetical protein C3B54_111132 [Pontimonas salivibrio]
MKSGATYTGPTMKNPFVITALLSLALWAVIVQPAFEQDTLLAWVATIFLVGWGVFGLVYSARGEKGKGRDSK